MSSIFYKQLLLTKVFFVAFLQLQFVFIFIWRKDIGKKTARKMLVILTTEYHGVYQITLILVIKVSSLKMLSNAVNTLRNRRWLLNIKRIEETTYIKFNFLKMKYENRRIVIQLYLSLSVTKICTIIYMRHTLLS